MSNSMTPTHRNTRTDVVHSQANSKLTLLPRLNIVRIQLTLQQVRREQSQPFAGLLIRPRSCIQGAQGLDAVVETPEAGAEPVVRRCCEAELWIEDDQSGAHAGVEEAVLMVCRVVCSAGQAEVLWLINEREGWKSWTGTYLASRQACGDGDQRDCWLIYNQRYVRAFNRVTSELLRLTDVVCESLHKSLLL